ncbi:MULTISPECIES: hypothetical protein [Aphanothece]|uniref:hypothetical protein n=1 Tax=Aphanothece TaxID=1121 RepID=UPI0039846375
MSDLDAFLRWNSGHLLENRTRGAYAEWLVHWRWPEPRVATSKHPPLSPKPGWLSDGRQVLHFRPTHWDRWSQRLELITEELLPD